jgi:hypothetical protein
MACEDFQAELSAWIDGESTGEGRARLAAHLPACSACAETLRALQNISALLRSLPVPRAPASITQPAMHQVRAMGHEPAARRMSRMGAAFRPVRRSIGIAVTGLAAAIAIAVLFGRHELAKSPTASDSQGYHLSSAPDAASDATPAGSGYDFRDPKTHGRRDIATFDARERFAWEHGTWHHDQRFDRSGWWWEVDGAWYWYERPTGGPPSYVSELRFTGGPGSPDRNPQQQGSAKASPPQLR